MLLCKNYAMPVKTMIYDAMNYGDQVNEGEETSIRKTKIINHQMRKN